MENDELQATETFCDATPTEMAEWAEYLDKRDADFIECLEYLYFADAIYVDDSE